MGDTEEGEGEEGGDQENFQALGWLTIDGNVMFKSKKHPCKEENNLVFWRQSQIALEKRMNVI